MICPSVITLVRGQLGVINNKVLKVAIEENDNNMYGQFAERYQDSVETVGFKVGLSSCASGCIKLCRNARSKNVCLSVFRCFLRFPAH